MHFAQSHPQLDDGFLKKWEISYVIKYQEKEGNFPLSLFPEDIKTIFLALYNNKKKHSDGDI